MSMVADVKITDNSAEYKNMLRETMEKALVSIGAEAEGYAKERCPVDTGRLKNSITYVTNKHKSRAKQTKVYQKGDSTANGTPEKGSVYIGTNVEYAEEQETVEMHHKIGNAHFLRNAATQHTPEYQAIVRAAMEAQGG